MIGITNRYHWFVGWLHNYSNLCVESKLYMDEKILSFDTAYDNIVARAIEPEGYVKYDSVVYVVKEVNTESDGKISVIAQKNVEELEGKVYKSFSFSGLTPHNAVIKAINGTSWSAIPFSSTVKRSLSLEYVSAYEILKEIGALFHVNFKFDTSNKSVTIVGSIGNNHGRYLSSDLNLRKLSLQQTSYDFFTQLEAYGKDGLTFASINDGKNYIEDYHYYADPIIIGSYKEKRYIWNAPDYDSASALLADAKTKLKEMAYPYISYQIDAMDISKIDSNYNFNPLNLGETITIIDEYTGVFDKQILIEKKEYPDDPEKNTYTFANKTMKLTDLMGKSSGQVSNVHVKKSNEVSDTLLFDSGGSSSGNNSGGSGDIIIVDPDPST